NHYMKEPWQITMYQEEGKNDFIEAIIRSYQRIGMIKQTKDQKTKQLIHSLSQFLLDIPHHALIYFKKDENNVRYEEDYAAVCAFIQNRSEERRVGNRYRMYGRQMKKQV